MERNHNLRSVFLNLLLFVFLSVTISCEKRQTCYECTVTFVVTQTYMGEISTWSTSDTHEFCDMTEEEKNEYEVRNSGTSTEESSGVTTVTVSTAECVR